METRQAQPTNDLLLRYRLFLNFKIKLQYIQTKRNYLIRIDFVTPALFGSTEPNHR